MFRLFLVSLKIMLHKGCQTYQTPQAEASTVKLIGSLHNFPDSNSSSSKTLCCFKSHTQHSLAFMVTIWKEIRPQAS